jgi:hypothetical protein
MTGRRFPPARLTRAFIGPALVALGFAGAVAAQPAPEPPPAAAAVPAEAPSAATPIPTEAAGPAPVAVKALAAPDLFSPAGAETGLPPELWRGTSPAILRAVLPLLAARPLSPAAQALARRVLATGASGPGAAGNDPALAGARVNALIAQGGVKAAREILAKTSGLDQRPALAQAAAEIALLAGDADRACALGDGLAVGREEIYWLRLRAWCQARKGDTDAAQLTLDLAQSQARDLVFGRLMSARLSGTAPGAASLRSGLDYVLSRDLGLDLAKAQPAPAVAAALNPHNAGPAVWSMEAGPGAVRATLATLAAGDIATARTLRASLTEADTQAVFDLALLDAAFAAATGKGVEPALDRLIERGGVEGPKTRARAQVAAVILAALGSPMSDDARGQFAGFTAGESKAPPGRTLALDEAGGHKRLGETALLALWIASDAGPGGPVSGDRARIIRALKAAGLEADARAFALEGLLALR